MIFVLEMYIFFSNTYPSQTYWKNCHNAMLEWENGLQSLHICKPAENLKYLLLFFSVSKTTVFWHSQVNCLYIEDKQAYRLRIFPKNQP